MLSASDVALLSGNGRNCDNGFGDGNGWWIIVFLIFALGGWGNGGFGGFGGNRGGSVADMYTLNSDFATLQRLMSDGFSNVNSGLTQINNGLCNGFYRELENTNLINSNIANSTATIQQTLCQGFNGLTSAIDSCCCATQRAIDGVNFNMQTGFNSINQTLCGTTRDIIENQNANYRALHDEIVANRIEDKNAQIQAQQNEINALRLAASQEKQNSYLISQLAPKCPEPAYVVQPPQNVTFPTNCCGNIATFNGGCGCGNY